MQMKGTHAPLKTGTADKPFYGSLFPANRGPPLRFPSLFERLLSVRPARPFPSSLEGDRGWKFKEEEGDPLVTIQG